MGLRLVVSGHFNSGQEPTRKIVTPVDAHLGQVACAKDG